MAYLRYTVGLGLWRQMRHFLKSCQFRDVPITWIESPGWLEREFTIKGDPPILRVIQRDLDGWVAQLNANPE